MEYRGEIELGGEKVMCFALSEDDKNRPRESGWHAARLIWSDAACDFGADDKGVSCDAVTSEDIIGPPVFDRDWTKRLPREKPLWHYQAAFADLPLVCTSVHGDTEDEAAETAFERSLLKLQGEGLIDPEDEDSGPEFPEDFEDENGKVVYCVHAACSPC